MQITCPRCGSSLDSAGNVGHLPIGCPVCRHQFFLDAGDTLDFRPPQQPAAFPSLLASADRYEWLERIGSGSLGEVWKARDRILDRPVAIKVARAPNTRLAQEASILARFQHPGLPRVVDVGWANGQGCLVTEFVEGESLASWTSGRKQFSPHDAAMLCEKLAWALQHAHDRGVIHRDLKPANIVVRPTGLPCIIDFGVAALVADSEPGGRIVGTPAYMAPEQVQGAAIDHRIDIYALGTILYELCAGRLPFGQTSIQQLFQDVLQTEPPALCTSNPAPSPQLESICLKCLAKRPADRYQTAHELAQALHQASAELSRDQLPGDTVAGRAAGWFEKQFSPSALAIIAVLAVVATVRVAPGTMVFALVAASLVCAAILLLTRTLSRQRNKGLRPVERPLERMEWTEPALTGLERRVAELDRMLVTSQAEHQLYRSLVESLPLCVFRTDATGKIAFANDFFHRTFSLSPGSVVGKPLRDIFPGSIADKQAAGDRHVMTTGKVVEGLEEYSAPGGGEPITFEVIKLPVRNFRGDTIGVQAILLDVSAHAKAEKALREAKHAAEDANAAKSMFLANMSHEIRTPLNAIIGLTDLLLKQDQNDENKRQLSLVLRSALSLLTIIDEILDFSKIEAGHLELRREPFDLRELLEQVRATFAIPREGKEIAVSLAVAADVPAWVAGDPVRLRQVLMNLMGNALKFTERGEVALAVDRQQEQSQPNEQVAALRFAVRDTGVGIAADRQQVIFAPFVQADGSVSRRFGGTGLGLAICAQLVQRMGGTITVKSRAGQGSVFSFIISLPIAQAPQPDLSPNAASSGVARRPGRLRILVAEDNAINQEFAARALRAEGHIVVVANNGQEAVDAVQRAPFDLVLMDVQMPVLDGLEATAKIRQLAVAHGGRVPIVAMTAHALNDDRDKCLAAGMNGYIGKPILVDDLYRAIGHVLASLPARLATIGEAPQGNGATEPFDRAKFLALAGNDQEFIRRILAMFAEDYPRLMGDIKSALAAHDVKSLLQSTHALKGVISNFHATAASTGLAQLETSSRQEKFDLAQVHCESLQFELDRLKNALNAFIASAS